MAKKVYAATARRRTPTHPGEIMRETLDHLDLSIAEAARRMKITRAALYAVLNGRAAVTPEMAVRFSKIGGGEPSLLVQMQGARDLWLAEQRLADQFGAAA